MTLRISGKHMDVGDAFRIRINDRIGEAIGKYFDRGFSGHVTVVKAGSPAEIVGLTQTRTVSLVAPASTRTTNK